MQDGLDNYSKEDLLMLRAQWVLRQHEKDFKALMECSEFKSYWTTNSGGSPLMRQMR